MKVGLKLNIKILNQKIKKKMKMISKIIKYQ